MFRSCSLPVYVSLTVAVVTFGHWFPGGHCLPWMGAGDPQDALLYDRLHDALSQATLEDDAYDPHLPSVKRLSLSLPRPQFFPHPPTDTPSLTDLLRSAMRTARPGRRSRAFPQGEQPERGRQGREAAAKRSFDSISRSSGFGLSRGSWGGAGRYGDNLSFTFESLFPVIARRLRSIS